MTTCRLAAILAADVVGFSRMMSLDEEGTLARLNALRSELFDPHVAEFEGRTIKLMGDGALCEFPSAASAVRCAVEIQRALLDRNKSMTWLAGAYLNARRYGEALAWIEDTLLRDASYPLTHLFHAITLAHMGEGDRARSALEACERVSPGFVQKFASWRPYRRAEDNDHMLDGLRMAGGPG
jgi:hypothetical protein